MVVTKDSGSLGYPNEIVVPLNEDHHTVCKYESQGSKTYYAVKETLRELVESSCDATQAIQGTY